MLPYHKLEPGIESHHLYSPHKGRVNLYDSLGLRYECWRGIESHRLEIEQKKNIDSGSSRKTSASSISNKTESKYLEMGKDI